MPKARAQPASRRLAMTGETTEDNVMRQLRFDTEVRAAVLILLTTFFAGCGGGSSTSQMTPSTQNANVAGQYNLVLTSAGGLDTTSIYANFTQTGASFTGGRLLCLSGRKSALYGKRPCGLLCVYDRQTAES
jgi:hypothetical protein